MSLVCVGTPSAPHGGTDLFYLKRAVDDIVASLRTARPPVSRQHAVIIRNTVPPGTVEDVVMPVLADGLADVGIAVGAGMCPEFLREGSGIAAFHASPLVVAGL